MPLLYHIWCKKSTEHFCRKYAVFVAARAVSEQPDFSLSLLTFSLQNFSARQGLTKRRRRGIVYSWLVSTNQSQAALPSQHTGNSPSLYGRRPCPPYINRTSAFFSLLQAGVLLFAGCPCFLQRACGGPALQCHSAKIHAVQRGCFARLLPAQNKTGTHAAHFMGAGSALIRYALAGDDGMVRGGLAWPHARKTKTEKIRSLCHCCPAGGGQRPAGRRLVFSNQRYYTITSARRCQAAGKIFFKFSAPRPGRSSPAPAGAASF